MLLFQVKYIVTVPNRKLTNREIVSNLVYKRTDDVFHCKPMTFSTANRCEHVDTLWIEVQL